MNSLSKFIAQCFLSALLAPILVVLTGCGTTQYADQDRPSTNDAPVISGTPVSVPPSSAGSQTNQAGADTLRAGDRINVSFSGLPVSIEKHEEQIREDGYINPPFLGRTIKAAGKSIGQLREELQKLYVPDYFKSATITVTRQDSYGGGFEVVGHIQFLEFLPQLADYFKSATITVTRQ